MKKILAMLAMTSLLTLTACGGGGKLTATDSKEKKITFWHIETGKRQEVINEAVKRFKQKHPDVEVEVVAQKNDAFKTKLTVAMGGGNPPDIFQSWGGGWLGQFVKAGQVYDITGKVDTSQYVPAALKVATYDNKVMGLPVAMAVVPVWYNAEIFKRYGLQPPKTWDELMVLVETLKKNNVIPFAIANKTKWPGAFYLMYFADRIGGEELFKKAFTRNGGSFDDPVYVQSGEYIQKLVKADAFPKGFNGLDEDSGQARQLIYTGKAAMILQGSWFLNNIRAEDKAMEQKMNIFPFPSIPEGKGDPSSVVGGVSPVYSISKSSKNPELALELLKEIASKETIQGFVDKSGAIPAMKGINIKDDFTKKFVDMLNKAKSLQTYYDQTLPPELAELHKDTTQAIFGLTMTPQEAAKKMEEKAKEVLK